jgi:hypothetical protein
MKFLNTAVLDAVDPPSFRKQRPFPWTNPRGILTEEGYALLCKDFPDISIFEKDYGRARKFNQPPHDRYRLHYHKAGGKLPRPWEEFIAELEGSEYRDFIGRLLGVKAFDLRLEWHQTEGGSVVSPHLDGSTTYGAHLFYFNTDTEWKPEWGGATLILVSSKKWPIESNPQFSDFKAIPVQYRNNHSLIFLNCSSAWHGVYPLSSPPGVYRKLFTVFVSKRPSPRERLRNIIRKALGIDIDTT